MVPIQFLCQTLQIVNILFCLPSTAQGGCLETLCRKTELNVLRMCTSTPFRIHRTMFRLLGSPSASHSSTTSSPSEAMIGDEMLIIWNEKWVKNYGKRREVLVSSAENAGENERFRKKPLY